MLVCPGCGRLVHAAELSSLAAEAETATREARPSDALAAWRRALGLLPPNTAQARAIDQRIQALSKEVDAAALTPAPAPAAGKGKAGAAGIAAAVALFLWKFKALLLLVATKGKLLLLGLTKLPTLLSMFFAFGAYWTLWGWQFALGFVLGIYVHEMGHVMALRRYGIAASAPMFIPGLGAFVRLNQRPANAREDAVVGLAGPVWGLAAACVFFALHLALESPLMAALAHVAAYINLFNLLPVWQLDGARGFVALSRMHRLWCVAAFGLAWFVSGDTLLLLVGVVAAVRSFDKTAPEQSDRRTLVTFLVLVAVLSGLLALTPQAATAHP